MQHLDLHAGKTDKLLRRWSNFIPHDIITVKYFFGRPRNAHIS